MNELDINILNKQYQSEQLLSSEKTNERYDLPLKSTHNKLKNNSSSDISRALYIIASELIKIRKILEQNNSKI